MQATIELYAGVEVPGIHDSFIFDGSGLNGGTTTGSSYSGKDVSQTVTKLAKYLESFYFDNAKVVPITVSSCTSSEDKKSLDGSVLSLVREGLSELGYNVR